MVRFLKRLGIGLLKGLAVGGLTGAAIQIGLGWTVTIGLLGYLLAMGIGATAGILAGTPPWRSETWIEAVLKGLFGVGVGALLYWVASSFASFEVPFAVAGAPRGTAWTSLPLLYGPVIGALFGAVVELDNTGDGDGAATPAPAASKKKKPPPVPGL